MSLKFVKGLSRCNEITGVSQIMLNTVTFTRQVKYLFHHVSVCNSMIKWKKVIANEVTPPHRPNPCVMKLNSPQFHSIFTAEVNTLAEIFKKYNYELRVAGGAVRDILMGIQPKDLDFATTATPDQMKEMFTKENIRMLNTNGERHGTITPRINDKENFEITTLRIDTTTDGRHAEVEFTTDWKVDANRRDLTINSMFLGLDGYVYDYFYGIDDLMEKKVIFVGNPSIRIREDYIRILRYFRFYGRIVDKPDSHNDETINAIKENISGLSGISGERIWTEWFKIFEGRYVVEITKKMLECRIAPHVGLPDNPDIDNFEKIYRRSLANGLALRPITLVASLLKNDQEVMTLHNRLKLSAFERDLALFIVRNAVHYLSDVSLKSCQRLILCQKSKSSAVQEFAYEMLRYNGMVDVLNELKEWVIPHFPISGTMLKPHVPHARLIGSVMTALKDIWIDDDFRTSSDDLMSHVPRIVTEVQGKLEKNTRVC